MTDSSKRSKDTQQGMLIALAVFAVSVALGVFVLPRLRTRPHHSASAFVGQPAADFILPVISGKNAGTELRLSDLQGRAVLLDFWASWCMPCQEQAGIIERVAARLMGPKLAIYGVNTSDQRSSAERYIAEHAPSYPMLFDGNSQAARNFDVSGLPTLVVLDKGGIVRVVESRVVGESELESLVRETLGG